MSHDVPPPPHSRESERPTFPLLHALIIDDTPDDRTLARRELLAVYPEAQVIEASTRAEFDAAMERGGFGLVITDLELKWGDGRDLFNQVRAADPSCPVVMFTGSGDETVAVDLMKAGLDDYVVKSARQLPRLRASIRLAVEGARQRSALSLRERELSAALARERTITRELQHRVKNNLQTIVGLLTMRARSRGGDVAAELRDLVGRMQALGQVQARLYEGNSLNRVDFVTTCRDIAEQLVRIHKDGQVSLVCHTPDTFDLDVARAMPLSLLIYEVLLNACKHAWPDDEQGTLKLSVSKSGDTTLIVISDDGIGYAEGAVTPGLGQKLAAALAQEAGAEMTCRTAPVKGTEVTLKIRL